MWRRAFSPHLFPRHEGEVYHQSGLDCCWKSSEATPSFYFNTFIECLTLSLRPGLKRCTASSSYLPPPPPPSPLLPPPPVCLSAHYCTPKQSSTHTHHKGRSMTPQWTPVPELYPSCITCLTPGGSQPKKATVASGS